MDTWPTTYWGEVTPCSIFTNRYNNLFNKVFFKKMESLHQHLVDCYILLLGFR